MNSQIKYRTFFSWENCHSNQPNASPLCRRWHVLREVHDGQDGEEGDPGLLEVVRDGREHQSGAAIGLHPLVGDSHTTPKVL